MMHAAGMPNSTTNSGSGGTSCGSTQNAHAMLPMVSPPPNAHQLPIFSSDSTVPMAIIKALSTSRRVFWFFIQCTSIKKESSLMDDPTQVKSSNAAVRPRRKTLPPPV